MNQLSDIDTCYILSVLYISSLLSQEQPHKVYIIIVFHEGENRLPEVSIVPNMVQWVAELEFTHTSTFTFLWMGAIGQSLGPR